METKEYQPVKLDRGYVTNALTDGDKRIFGLVKECKIKVCNNEAEHFYWSEVYVEPNCMAMIIRRSMLLRPCSDAEMSELNELSKTNLGTI